MLARLEDSLAAVRKLKARLQEVLADVEQDILTNAEALHDLDDEPAQPVSQKPASAAGESCINHTSGAFCLHTIPSASWCDWPMSRTC